MLYSIQHKNFMDIIMLQLWFSIPEGTWSHSHAIYMHDCLEQLQCVHLSVGQSSGIYYNNNSQCSKLCYNHARI